jgi:thymidylate kinase
MRTIHGDVSRETVGDSRHAPGDRGPGQLDLVSTLCHELARYDIAYCHWKSNDAIERSATGDNDLDLLIAREHVTKFAEILAGLGFKEAIDPREQQLPGVVSFYGRDRHTSTIVHVHAHFKLVLGHDYTKNYHIPIEEGYLASARQDGLFKIPAPELEFPIFVIRMVLKHCTWDTILIRHGRLSPSEKRELDYLEGRVRPDQLDDILREHVPWMDRELLDRCAEAIRTTSSIWSRVAFGHELQRRLKPYSRRPRIADLALKLWRRVARPVRRRLLKRSAKARLSTGGIVLAVVGGDGAGKSTTVAELRDWLSKGFDTLALHIGKPRWSYSTLAVRGLLKICRLGFTPKLKPIQYSLDTTALEFPGYTWAIWEVCTARDRYLTYLRARRFAANGGIAICDRYPLPEVKLMDGPQIRRFAGAGNDNMLTRLLIEAEERYYARMTRPDLVVVLRVEPELAVARKTNESPETVRPRSSEIWDIDWSRKETQIVDASQPMTEVLSQVKALAWSKI